MFKSFPLWINIIIFIISAGIIWVAGTYLEFLADVISQKTNMGKAFTGLLLLATCTSLPEIATTITATVFLNNPTLAVFNLLGSLAFNLVVLVIADAVIRKKGALTYFSPNFVLLIEGVGVIILLQLVNAGISTKGTPVFFGFVSLWTVLIFIGYLILLYLTKVGEGHPRWEPKKESSSGDQSKNKKVPERKEKIKQYSIQKIWVYFGIASVVVLAAGWSTAQAADVLAKTTGLGSAFLGATLLAMATSLPELSTTTTASRHNKYKLAVSNIFGSNAFDVALLFVAELLYVKSTIMKFAKDSVLFIASIGGVMTGIYLWGLLERDDKTIMSIGWDSAAVLIIYIGAMIILYFMS